MQFFEQSGSIDLLWSGTYFGSLGSSSKAGKESQQKKYINIHFLEWREKFASELFEKNQKCAISQSIRHWNFIIFAPPKKWRALF
jgi:hypothetical protein